MNTSSTLDQAYHHDTLYSLGETCLNLMVELYRDTRNKEKKVIEYLPPDEGYEAFLKGDFGDVECILRRVFQDSIRLHHPGYMGHQVSPPLPLAVMADFFASWLNNGMAVYEMGQTGVHIEKCLIEDWKHFMQWEKGAGLFTSGGSVGNLTALLSMRNRAIRSGIRISELAVAIPGLAHYSLKRSLEILGLQNHQILLIPENTSGKSDFQCLSELHSQAIKQGLKLQAVCANFCSTSLGLFDDIAEAGTYCHRHELWLHIDGAHGFPFVLLECFEKEKEELARYADSVVMDYHKMLMCPALVTLVLFKEKADAFSSFNQEADYLLATDHQDDPALATLECTKKLMALKPFLIEKVYGKSLYREYLHRQLTLCKDTAELIASQKDFELAVLPESNILCFRYKPDSCSGEELDALNNHIRTRLLADGNFYIVKTKWRGKLYLRMSLMNAFTRLDNIQELLVAIRKINPTKSDMVQESSPHST